MEVIVVITIIQRLLCEAKVHYTKTDNFQLLRFYFILLNFF
jgi:hypothetical protein